MDLVVDPVVVWTARLVLAAVLGAAAIGKLRAIEGFVGVVHNYRILPAVLVRPVAYALPALELAVALGLLIGPFRPQAAAAALLLLLVFALAMAINLARGRVHIDCGCFAAALRQRLSWGLVGRNFVLAGLALVALPQTVAVRPLVWLDVVTIAAATASALLLYIAFSQLQGMTLARRETGEAPR